MKIKELSVIERQMVKSNLDRIADKGLKVSDVVALLRVSGYPAIAAGVEAAAWPKPIPRGSESDREYVEKNLELAVLLLDRHIQKHKPS
jgi:hypothetical protein